MKFGVDSPRPCGHLLTGPLFSGGVSGKKWELFPRIFHLSYSNQPKRFVIQMNTGNINKTTVGSHNWQNLNFIS